MSYINKRIFRFVAVLLMTIFVATTIFAFPGAAQAASFSPRLTAPVSSNSYYTTNNIYHQTGWGTMFQSNGTGYCTTYAWGRAYEITGKKPSIPVTSASQWWTWNANNRAYSYGSEPQLGAIICWATGAGGGGHVAVVEKIEGNNVTFSESNQGGIQFRTFTIAKGSMSAYTKGFQGYIYITSSAGSGTTTSASINPHGYLDAVAGAAGIVTVKGWAFDSDKPTTPIDIHVYIGGPAGSGGTILGTITANKNRADVGKAYPGVGDNHGFEETFSTTRTGQQTLYVYAIKAPGTNGSNVLIGTKTVNIPGATTSTPSTKTGTVTATAGLNVRSGPGTNYGVVGGLAYNTKVTITGESNGWYKIKYSNGEYWAIKDWIRV